MTDAARWQALSAWLDALLELASDEREVRLRELDTTQGGLAAELRSLLAADARDDGLLEVGLGALAPQVLGGLLHDADEIPPGHIVGRWRLLSRIGRGGMGVVFLAERADGEFEQRAALKRLHRGMDSDALLRRFAQERRILSQLDHPRIARLLDAGIDAQGQPYFAMDYVVGHNIAEYAKASGLDVRSRVELLVKVCDAVAHAQSRLVVHRDLKPSNVLVDAHGEPHLLDFGIAKILSDAQSDAPMLTGTGVRVLSPSYAAPEQIRGEPVGTATDVYALGVLLFELCTGALPHPHRGFHEALVASLQHDTAVRPSARLREQNVEGVQRAYGERWRERERFARDLGGDLDTIVLTALRTEPERRYASAAALGTELQSWLDGRPIAARPDSNAYRLRKFVGRHRAGVAAAALVLSSLIVGLGAALWQARIAQRHAIEAEQGARKAEETKRFVVSLFEATNPENARKGAQMTALDLLRDASARVEDGLDHAADTQAELRVTLGQSLFATGATDEGLAMVERGVEQLRGLGLKEILANGLHTLSMMYVQLGRVPDAERAAGEALNLLDASVAPMPLERISVRTTLAKLRQTRGDTAGAAGLYQQNLQERRALLGPDDARLAVDWNNIGAIALTMDEARKAREAYREALRLYDSDPQAPPSRRVWLQLGVAAALLQNGEFESAEQLLRETLLAVERSLHAEHPIAATGHRLMSEALRWQGRHDEAITAAREAVAIHGPLNHPDVGLDEWALGQALLAAGHDGEALATLTAAEHHLATLRNREDATYWRTLASLGVAQVRLGDRSGWTRIVEALVALESRGLERSVAYAEVMARSADAARLLGDPADARARALRARDLYSVLLAPSDPRLPTP